MRLLMSSATALTLMATTAFGQASVGAGQGSTRAPSESTNGAQYVPSKPAAVRDANATAAPTVETLGTIRGGATARPLTRIEDGRQVGEPAGAVSDRLFAAAAADGGMFELASSRIALERGNCPEVKAFAQRMIDDHTKASRELTELAASKGIAIPTMMGAGHLACQNILQSETGDEFDRCYAKQQHLAHVGTIALFEAEAKKGRDPEVRAWASKMLPTLKEHEKDVKSMCEMHEKDKEKDKSASPSTR